MMEFEQVANFLRTVPLFHTLDPDVLHRLTEQAAIRDIPQGDVIVRQGDESAELFILLQGEASAYSTERHSGFERKLRQFYPGEYFGLMNILTQERSPAEVRADEPCKFIVVARFTMDSLFQDVPSFGKSVCKSLAYHLHDNIINLPAIPFERLDSYSNLAETSKLLPQRISEYFQAIVVAQDGDRLKVGIVDPSDKRGCEFIRDVLAKYDVDFVAISEDDFSRHFPKHVGAEGNWVSSTTPYAEVSFIDGSGNRSRLDEDADHGALVRMLTAGIRAGVSDIHLEPTMSGGRIRFRLDGRLIEFGEQLTHASLKQIISRLKVMADLDITNARKPQDGRFMVVVEDRTVEFRESIMPCYGGEKMVLRVISADANLQSLEGLFISHSIALFAREIFKQPSGLVLVTGPTGAGKTTTLYAALQMLNAEYHARNIVTVEDPIEYRLPFATQIQVDNQTDLTFGRILRSVLRQDPDIIMVGEIRDQESAAIAIEAATTGHLVLSSLHTHSAIETLARLRNLEVPSYLLADALKGVISQKLVPRIHPAYAEPVHHEDEVLVRLRRLGVVGPADGNFQRGRDTAGGPVGGETGRIGIFELLAVNDQLSDLIDREATRSDLIRNLSDSTYFSFNDYARMLLVEGRVAPEQIERVMPRQPSLVDSDSFAHQVEAVV